MTVVGNIRFYAVGICLVLAFSCFQFTASGIQKDANKQRVIVIDPGHGGKDPGTVVGKAKEKNIVLDIGLKLGRLIRNNLKDVKVVFTRDGDYFIPLMDRPQIANKVNADLFISIHANYCKTPSVYGTETYVLGLHRTEDNLDVAKKENSVILLEEDYTTRYEGFNPNLSESYIMFELIQDAHLDQSLRFASILQTNFKNQAQRNDRDVRQAGFLVLRETAMPSVLIETGYLSNKKENSFLLTEAGRNEITESIFRSLVSYIGKSGSFEQVPVPRAIASPNDGKKAEKTSQAATPPKQVTEAKKNDTLPALSASDGKPDKPSENKTPAKNRSETKDYDKRPYDNKTTYAVQLGLFSKRLDPSSKTFEGLTPIREIEKNGKYRYFCFESDSFEKTKANFSRAVKRFPDAYIVSITNNQVTYVWGGTFKK